MQPPSTPPSSHGTPPATPRYMHHPSKPLHRRYSRDGTCGRYMHHPSKPPSMESSSVLSILISAEFLQMTSLVELCLSFLHQVTAQ